MGWSQVADLSGPQGDPGTDGVSVVDAEVNGSGNLILTLSNSGTIDAGHVVGAPGGGIDFESSVATEGDLPDYSEDPDPPYGEARYVQADGHLYVYEEDGGGTGTPGWTDVGAIRGETGATGSDGSDGADGVSVTTAAVNEDGDLIISLSSGGPVNAGHVVGATGSTGADGSDGADGVSVTNAAVDGSGDLVVTLSVGGPINAGHVVGTDGADGDDGAPGPGWTSSNDDPTVDPTNNLVFHLNRDTGVVWFWAP